MKLRALYINYRMARTHRSGFTLIELATTLVITLVLMSFVAGINRTSERQVLLLREKTLFIANLNKIKAYALQSMLQSTAPCGYGMHIILPNEYILFKDISGAGDVQCLNADHVYSGSSENLQGEQGGIELYELPKGLRFRSAQINTVVFIPPESRVIMTPNLSEADIVLETDDGGTAARIRINVAGYITSI